MFFCHFVLLFACLQRHQSVLPVGLPRFIPLGENTRIAILDIFEAVSPSPLRKSQISWWTARYFIWSILGASRITLCHHQYHLKISAVPKYAHAFNHVLSINCAVWSNTLPLAKSEKSSKEVKKKRHFPFPMVLWPLPALQRILIESWHGVGSSVEPPAHITMPAVLRSWYQ